MARGGKVVLISDARGIARSRRASLGDDRGAGGRSAASRRCSMRCRCSSSPITPRSPKAPMSTSRAISPKRDGGIDTVRRIAHVARSLHKRCRPNDPLSLRQPDPAALKRAAALARARFRRGRHEARASAPGSTAEAFLERAGAAHARRPQDRRHADLGAHGGEGARARHPAGRSRRRWRRSISPSTAPTKPTAISISSRAAAARCCARRSSRRRRSA